MTCMHARAPWNRESMFWGKTWKNHEPHSNPRFGFVNSRKHWLAICWFSVLTLKNATDQIQAVYKVVIIKPPRQRAQRKSKHDQTWPVRMFYSTEICQIVHSWMDHAGALSESGGWDVTHARSCMHRRFCLIYIYIETIQQCRGVSFLEKRLHNSARAFLS